MVGAVQDGAAVLGHDALFRRNPLPMWMFDVETLDFLDVNDAAVASYGYSRDEFLDMTILDIRPANERAAVVLSARAVRDELLRESGLWHHVHRDGEIVEVEITTCDVVVNARPARLALVHDVTEQRRLHASLAESEERFRLVFAAAPVAQVLLTLEGTIMLVNPAGCDLTAHDASELTNHDFAAATGFCGDEPLADFLAGLAAGSRDAASIEGRIIRRDGRAVDVRIEASIVHDGDGNPRHVIALVDDITARKEVDRLAQRATLDPLTGLVNRQFFVERLEDLLRGPTHGLAVLFVDLDRFKQLNDRLGHSAGDTALIEVTQRLRTALRPDDLICRFGGDEFTVLCQHVATDAAAVHVCERITEALSAPIRIERQAVSLTASVGVVRVDDSGMRSVEALLRAADQAMYEAKQRGRGGFHLFSAVNRAATRLHFRRAGALRRAIDAGELETFFQPVVRLDDFQVAGLEALVRWNDPQEGLVGPEQFIGVAEQTGLVVPLGAWVLRAACSQAMEWAAAGDAAADLSVNLSARQLTEPQLFDQIAGVLAETEFPAERLCLEITESALMDDVDAAIESLVGLKALGVRLAIDDFGTGYSSLNYLRRFPVDIVKIDRSFIAGLGIDSSAEAIVAAVTNLSHALGLTVIAEGVETADQLVAVRALGCDQAQGFYWSPPLPATAVRHWKRMAQPGAAPAPIDVRPLVAQRVNAMRLASDRIVTLELPEKLPLFPVDPDVLKTIIDHLLGNAVRYSDGGQPIAVDVSADRRWFRVTVADYGVGMNADEVRRCFEPFWKAQGQRPGGAGVGLYIVRALVEAMGGNIRVNSAPGRGSTFALSLPRTLRGGMVTDPGGNNAALRTPGIGAPSVIHEFMRQLGVPTARRP